MVTIPLSLAGGIGVTRHPLNLAPGKYLIQLTVERAVWDKNAQSVAKSVEIGGNYLTVDNTTKRDLDKSSWLTQKGALRWAIPVPANSSAIAQNLLPPYPGRRKYAHKGGSRFIV